MSRRPRLRLGLLAAVIAGLLTAGSALAAPPFPERIDLPEGWQPEGITSHGTTFYAGSLATGAIWQGNLRTGAGSVLVPGGSPPAVGIDYEAGAKRLWVAGGDSGEIRVYDARSGAHLRTYTVEAGFLNDVIVTNDAAYVTDSFIQQLIVIPLGPGGRLPDQAVSLPLGGDIAYVPDQFNVNGIEATRGWLIVVQSNTGQLFRVDPATGEGEEIELSGAGATAAFGDGLEIHGSTLYVVRNFANEVAVFALGPRLEQALLLGTLTDPSFDIPTTATFAAGRLWAVNARFLNPDPAGADYWVTRLPARP